MSNKKKIIFGSLIDVIGNIVSSIISFIFIKLYFNIVSKEEYGIWLAINGVASLIGLVDIGVDQFLITQLTNPSLFRDKKINTILSNSLVIKAIIALLFFIIGFIVFSFLSFFIKVPYNYLEVAKITFLVNVVFIIFNIFYNTTTTILISKNHFSLVNSVVVSGSILNSFLVFFLLKKGLGIISFPITLLLIGILQFLMLFFFIRKNYPHISLGKIDLKGQREMISYSFSFQITKVSYVVRNQFLFIAINNIVGPVYVTLYSITNRIPQMVGIYMNKFVNPFFPTFCELVNQNDNDKLKSLVIRMTKFLIRFSIFFCMGVYFFNERFISIWVGVDKFSGYLSFAWLLLFTFITSSFCGFGIIIYSTKKFEKLPAVSIVEVILTITLTYLFGISHGFIGVLAGFVIGSSISQFYMAYISFKQIGLSIKEFFKNSYSYIFYPNIISLLFLFFIGWKADVSNIYKFLFWCLVYLLSNLCYLEFPKLFKSKEKGFINKLKFAFQI